LIRNIEPILVRGAEAKRERAEAARQAEEEEQRTETGWRAAEEGRRAEAARRAEEEKQRAEAARLAEEEKRQVEAARLAEEEKQRAEVARLAEEEKRRAEAAAQAENERDSQAAWERPRGATKPSAKQLPKQSPWLKRRTQIVLSGAGVVPAAIALAVSHNHDDLFVVLVVVLVALATLYAIRSGRKWVPYVSAGLNPLLTAFWVWAVFFIPDRDKSLMCALFALTLLIESAVAFFNVRARGGFTAA